MSLKGLIKWAMKQQLRFIKKEEIEEFGQAFLKNVDEELGIDDQEEDEECPDYPDCDGQIDCGRKSCPWYASTEPPL